MSANPLAEVKAVAQAYLDGTAARDVHKLAEAFYSSCNLHSINEQGRLEIVARDRFFWFAEHEGLPPHTSRVVDVRTVHDMGFAEVRFDFPSFAFVDYLTLLRIQGRWRIVSKVYTKVT